jgi:hypothetical protein
VAGLVRRLTSPEAAWFRSVALPLVLAAVCLRSLVDGGYLVQLDAVFGPQPSPVDPGFSLPVLAAQAAAVEVVGGELTGRVYALAALAFAGFAPMVLVRAAPWYAQCAAGVLGMLNPWIYARIVEGHWAIAIAASGLFLWVAAWERLQSRPGLRSATLLGLCGAALAAFDPHVLGPIAALALVGFLAQRVWRSRARLIWLAVAVALQALFLSYAVATFFVSDERGGYSTVRHFTRADFAFFRSVASDDYGLLVNLVGLYGYWGERVGRFPLANADAPWWPLTTAVLVAAALVGAWLRRDRAWLLVAGLLGLAMSASTALPGGVDAATRLASWIPLIGAYREPQKWSSLWLVALVALSASALDALARRRAMHSSPWVAPGVAYALVICALFPAGFAQIRSTAHVVEPVVYPDYWYASAAFLEQRAKSDDVVLVLPWHLYQPLAATGGRVVANPADVFFPGRLVIPRNLEIPGRFGESGSRYDAIGDAIRREGHGSCAAAAIIRRTDVEWVLVLDGLEGRETVIGLRRCGFALVQGRPGRTAVLRVP